jgi:hypothetical protein
MDQQFFLSQLSCLPQELLLKIQTFYFAFGTLCANIIRKEINDKCRNNTITLWKANVDYEIRSGKKYMLEKCVITCSWDALWDLRLAILEDEPQTNNNVNYKNFCIRVVKERTKNTLKQLLRDDDNIC